MAQQAGKADREQGTSMLGNSPSFRRFARYLQRLPGACLDLGSGRPQTKEGMPRELLRRLHYHTADFGLGEVNIR